MSAEGVKVGIYPRSDYDGFGWHWEIRIRSLFNIQCNEIFRDKKKAIKRAKEILALFKPPTAAGRE